MKWFFVASILLLTISPVHADKVELQQGDHICIVGNTMAERMQHYGWLETFIHARFPEHQLVFRNLGYSGDEIDGWQNFNHRLRSMDFGTHDQWLSGSAPCPQPGKLSPKDKDKVRENRFELTNTRADVIFAFYGYNESIAGEPGLLAFKQNVEAFIKHTLSQKYNGQSAPRLVLFSPIAHESLDDPNLPGKEAVAASNGRLKMYTAAMGEVAQANGVAFVDLFTPTNTLFNEPGETVTVRGAQRKLDYQRPATLNGIHLNDVGDLLVAQFADAALFEQELPNISRRKLCNAVVDKNFYWYNRYRVTDGFSTYGDRAFLKFSEGAGGYGEGLSNYSVGQRELEVLDVQTSNRDKVIWQVALSIRDQGSESQVDLAKFKADDSNIPEFIPVITNKPGPLPGGKHLFLSGQEAIERMTVHKGMKVELFADEGMFPELVKPVQMSFDTKGRLWVACWRTYPHWKPTEKMNDKLLILEDTNGDGKADKCTTFAGDIHNPTGFEFWGGGVLVAQGPDLLFLKDTNGDDKYDIKERLVHGFDTADTHHTINSFVLDAGGSIYMQEGTFHHSQIETPWGAPRRLANGGVFRYEPRTQKTDIYVTFGFANPHGHAFDAWGQDIVVDGTGSNPYHAPLFSSYLEYPHKHNGPPQVYQQRTRPCSAIEILSSSHFPEEHRGNLLVANVIGFQGILQYRLHSSPFQPESTPSTAGHADGSSLSATEVEPIVFSSDPNFRPGDIEVGPDGAIYFTDWQNPIIGHMQHNLRDPSRDHDHGRVYRVRHAERELLKPQQIAGQPISKLIELLGHKDDRVRYRARIELSVRDTPQVIAQTNQWTQQSGNAVLRHSQRLEIGSAKHQGKPVPQVNSELEHEVLEALWVHQSHNVVDEKILKTCLLSPESRVRAAAVRVIAAWHSRLSNSLELLREAAADESPRVRLMAIWAASFIPQAEAAEVVFIAAEQPTDEYLTFLSKEVLRTLQPLLDKAKSENRRVAFATEIGTRYFLKGLNNDQLLQEKRSRQVFVEMLTRPGLQDEHRRESIQELARLNKKTELQIIMEAIATLDGGKADETTSDSSTVVFDLVRQLTSRSAAELTTIRAEIEKLALTAKQPVFRQIGFVSLMNIDGTVEKAWELASKQVKSLQDFVNAMPLISDPSVRATLYEKVEPLLNGLPPAFADSKGTGTTGRYVRIELLGKATLTLAEVEVYSGGENVARSGKATQKNTAHGGNASRAFDGNKSPEYGSGGQTHTEENTADPFWELDLGEERPIDQIVIFNRVDGDLGQRLNNFTLRVLDNGRGEVMKLEGNKAPRPKSEFTLGGGGTEALIRRAAMDSLTYVRGQELKTFLTLAKFVHNDADRLAAVRALQRIPKANWPADQAAPLIQVLTATIKKIPTQDRTGPAALDLLEFADALSSLLPVDNAKAVRAELAELGVRVIRVGTIFEKMAFDKDTIAIRAGKPVEFVLDNSDLMPHNFVILQPGSLEEIGMMSEAQAQQPGFAERHYVPQSPKVLLSSTLLQPRKTQKLSFVAPTTPGVYPIVCTYPGHWRRMYAALYVVEDLDGYLAAPEAYLASAKLEAVDPLLKDRRPRTEWKLEELAQGLPELEKGRAYGSAKQMFTVATCVACHKLEGVGNNFGPDLSQLAPKFKPQDILKEILDPSASINEKFQSVTIETKEGQVITGLIVEETADDIKLIENPLVKSKILVIKKDQIEERLKSKTSMMPKGLLDKLSREEILDLIAYISARGNKNHPLLKGSAGHDHHKHNH